MVLFERFVFFLTPKMCWQHDEVKSCGPDVIFSLKKRGSDVFFCKKWSYRTPWGLRGVKFQAKPIFLFSARPLAICKGEITPFPLRIHGTGIFSYMNG